MPLTRFFFHVPQLSREAPSEQRKPKFVIDEKAVCLRSSRPESASLVGELRVLRTSALS